MPTLLRKVNALQQARATVARLSNEIVADLGLVHESKIKITFPRRGRPPKTLDYSHPAALPTRKKRKYTRRKPQTPEPVTAPVQPAKKKRRRAVITDAIRATLKKMVGDGNTDKEIAEALVISKSAVNRIKGALGLIKKK